jgi:hypothetical protein
MSDAWGGAWGVSWGSAWGSGVTPPSTPALLSTSVYSLGRDNRVSLLRFFAMLKGKPNGS